MNQHHSEIANATVVYIPGYIRRYVRNLKKEDSYKHPVQTKQGFDFFMNLGVYNKK